MTESNTSRRSVLAGLGVALALPAPAGSSGSRVMQLIAAHRAASAERRRAAEAVEEKVSDLPELALGPEISVGTSYSAGDGELRPIVMRSIAEIDAHIERLARSFDGVDKARAHRLRGAVRDRLHADFAAEAARLELMAEESGLSALRHAAWQAYERAERALDALFAEHVTSLEDCRALAEYVCAHADEHGWEHRFFEPLAHLIAGRGVILRMTIG